MARGFVQPEPARYAISPPHPDPPTRSCKERGPILLPLPPITASRPKRLPSGWCTTGTPPPPTAIGISSMAKSARMAATSRMCCGRGEATTRRYPRSVSPATGYGDRRASSSVKKPPIGSVGRAKAGSSGATRTRVRRVAVVFEMPAHVRALSSANPRRYPMFPCDSAPQTSSGIGGTVRALSSWRRKMLPTTGPFPCVMTTGRPRAMSATMARAASTVSGGRKARPQCRHTRESGYPGGAVVSPRLGFPLPRE